MVFVIMIQSCCYLLQLDTNYNSTQESNHNLGKELLAEKNPAGKSSTGDLSCLAAVIIGIYLPKLMKNNKIIAEDQQQKNKIQINIVLRKRLVDENGWQHYVYHQADTNMHYVVVTVGCQKTQKSRRQNGRISMILSPQHTRSSYSQLANTFQCCTTVK